MLAKILTVTDWTKKAAMAFALTLMFVFGVADAAHATTTSSPVAAALTAANLAQVQSDTTTLGTQWLGIVLVIFAFTLIAVFIRKIAR